MRTKKLGRVEHLWKKKLISSRGNKKALCGAIRGKKYESTLKRETCTHCLIAEKKNKC